MNDEEMAVENKDYLVTETTIDPSLPIAAVVEHLQQRRVVGQLIFHLSQGSVQRAALVERTQATRKQRQQVRAILDV